jgi:hypothetical protein
MKHLLRCVVRTAVVLGTVLTGSLASAAVINVPAGGDLQTALNAAQPGDVIVLPAGARFVGQFKFPAKAGMVTVRSSGTLPDRRVTPADASLMATIASGIGAMSIDMYGARNWTLDGIRFEPNTEGFGEIIGIQGAENIVLKRLLFVVPSTGQQKRFVLGNGRHITLTQSYCSGVWRTGQDSQCFVAWDGGGPFTITDNFLEAAGENVMFGGADSVSPDNVPSDILVENNFFTKRLEWKGQSRGVKNIFELKSARRVIVRNNVFERNWIDAQAGSAIVFTPRNQDGHASWSTVEDVLFEYNVVRDTPSHFNILGYDDIYQSGQATRITIRHNLLLGSGGGRMLTAGNEVGVLVFDHNTYVNPQPSESSAITLYAEGSIPTLNGTRTPGYAVNQLTFTNNMTHGNNYGLHSATGFGTAALTAMTRSYDWRNNVVAGGWGTYPATTNLLPLELYAVQFDSNYYLVSTSEFKSMATDGTDLGWNRSGATAPPPPPPCSYSVNPGSLSFGASGGTARVDVTTAAGCAWTTQSAASWATVGAGGSGAGSVNVSVASNSGSSRSTVVTIAGIAVTVSEAAATVTCSYDVTPTSVSFPATGGTATVSVSTPPGCTWSASSGVSWLSVSGSGNGPGTATITSGINSGASRTATVTVAGRAVSISQAAPAPAACTYSVSPTSLTVPATGGTFTVQVTTGSSCEWTTKSNNGWLKVSPGGSGSGTVMLTVNGGGGARTATANIAGHTVTVNQQGAPKGKGVK